MLAKQKKWYRRFSSGGYFYLIQTWFFFFLRCCTFADAASPCFCTTIVVDGLLFFVRGEVEEGKIKKRQMEEFFFRDIINKKKWANTAETIKTISNPKESRGVPLPIHNATVFAGGWRSKINWVVTRINYDGNKLSRCKHLQIYVATLDPFFPSSLFII